MAKTRQRKIRGFRALLLTAALAAGLLGVGAGLRGPYRAYLAEHGRRQLQTVSDDRAELLLDRVAQLGDAGISVMVEALGSNRASVAAAGKRVLLGQMRRWETLRARQTSPKLAILADALAGQVDQFDAGAQADAARLATRILDWPLDDSVVDSPGVIAACESVLRATAASRYALAQVRLLDDAGDDPPEGASGAGQLASDENGSPGGTPSVDEPPGSRDPSRVADVHVLEPAAAPLEQPRQLLAEPDRAGPIGANTKSPGGTGSSDSALRDPLLPRRQAGSIDPGPDGWALVDTVDLMRSLQAEDARRFEARAELTRRNFSLRHLELAERLFHPDVNVRKRLARAVPGLLDVDAVPWLIQLSRDADSEVRRVAITLMATTGDPGLLAEIERIARQDPDPAIQRQATRIAQERQRARY